MAPAKRSMSTKRKSRGIGVDFQKVKHKVGRKLLPSSNVTKVEVKSKAIVLPGQSVAQEKDGLAVNSRRQTLKELLMQTTHHNDTIRKETLLGIKDLLARHPDELRVHAVTIVEKLCPRITDSKKIVRQALLVLLRTSIFAGLSQVVMRPLIPVIMAYIFSAMTNLAMEIRMSAFNFLDAIIQTHPTFVASGYVGQIVQYYVDFLGKLGVHDQTGQLLEILDSLLQFLSAVRMKFVPENMTASVGIQAKQGYTSGSQLLQDGGRTIMALHSYKSAVTQDMPSSTLKSLGGQEDNVELQGSRHFSLQLADILVQALLNCWAECAPLVCSGQAPDRDSMECMVKICQALYLILLCIKPELELLTHRNINTQDVGTRLGNPAFGGKHMELEKWLKECAVPMFAHHLMAAFPIHAPPINLPKKVEESLIALNIAISEVMLASVIAGDIHMDCEHPGLTILLDYIEFALDGRMLPPFNLQSSTNDKRSLEVHLKSLIGFVPSLLHCISIECQTRILQAFTKVFQNCKASSRLKHVCLISIADILQPTGKTLLGADLFRFQKQWLQALPRLLWELKDRHSSSSLAVLQVLHHIGRSAPQNSPLEQEYTALQPILIPFFGTFSPSKHHQKRWLYGPFIKLPVECQHLAIDILYYFGSFSSSFLKSIAHCLGPELELSVIIRCVEVLQRAFCRGSIKLSDHLSFLFTLLVEKVSFQGITNIESGDYGKERTSFNFQKHRVIAGAVCSCLCQIGDGRVLLQLLNPSICQQLVSPVPSIISYGLIKMVAVLCGSCKDLLLPESLAELLPSFIADYLVSITMEKCFRKRSCTEEPSMKPFIQPCFTLLSKSDKLAESVIYRLHEALDGGRAQRLYATVVALLQVFQLEHVRNRLSTASEESSILRRFGDDKSIDLQDLEDKELQTISEKLFGAAAAVYGWPKQNPS